VKLAISNLAWDTRNEADIASALQQLGVEGIELAPTKIWSNPLEVPDVQVARCLEFWQFYGIRVIAFQSLLYARPDLALFDSFESREAMSEYLRGIIQLGARLEVEALVFGSPKNRRRGSLSHEEATQIATPFFQALGDDAAEHGVVLCIEPNPPEYGCDWITTSSEGHAFVQAVGSKGFGLNLDSGGMTIAGEDPAHAVETCSPSLRHFHISEPKLRPIGTTDGGGAAAAHEEFATALRYAGYDGWTSIEMLPPKGDPVEGISKAIRIASDIYG
jgi:D-psicose/D-tagatose/L-ribulose 3-epimerase